MNRLGSALDRAHPAIFCTYAGAAAFAAYFSMYAFRKPFTAATFDNVAGWDYVLDYKVALVIAQLVGYALSKLAGIRIIAEAGRTGRGVAILGLVGVSWLALLLFALVPAPWNVAALFLNGLPLGLIWGLVFSYVEGRRTSEVLGAILCSAFIVSSGLVKTVGGWILATGVSDHWMPAAVGALFLPLLALSVLGLSQLPPPSPQDEAERIRRAPMSGRDRAAFLGAYGPGVLLLVLAYVLFTAVRDFRDNFAAEIWAALGHAQAATMFTASELPVAAIALAVLAATMGVRDNRGALLILHAVIVAGALLLGLSTLAFQLGMLPPLAWMIASGAGLYMAYTPFNAMLFDRMIAATGRVGAAGFLIYVADASGYVGSVGLMLLKTFGSLRLDWLNFFILTAYGAAFATVFMVAFSGLYFGARLRKGGPGLGADNMPDTPSETTPLRP